MLFNFQSNLESYGVVATACYLIDLVCSKILSLSDCKAADHKARSDLILITNTKYG